MNYVDLNHKADRNGGEASLTWLLFVAALQVLWIL